MAIRTTTPTGDSKKIGAHGASDQSRDARAPASRGEVDIRIARDGTWVYKNSPIARKALAKLFSSVLRREADGSYWLVTPRERARVEVEDAPFTAVELSVIGHGPGQVLCFRTNVDDWVEAGPGTPIRVAHAPDTGEPRPYISVRDGLEALILRPVYYQLVEHVVERGGEDGATLGVWSNEVFFTLGCPD